MRRRTALSIGATGLAALAAMRYLGSPASEGPLFVRRAGSGGPALLCLHGLFASSACWLPLADRLAPECRLVMPDLVGFGSSPQPDADYTASFHLRWLAPVVAEAPRWIVIGHSMGCVLAAELALRWPEAVEALLLFNAPVYSSPAVRRRIIVRQNLLTRLSLTSPLAARLVCEATVCVPRPLLTRIAPWLRPDVPPEAASDYFRHTYDSYYSSLTNLVMGRGLAEILAAARLPVHVVQGSRDDLVEVGGALDWPAHVRVSVVEGADHTALLFRMSDRMAAIVRESLGRGSRAESRSEGRPRTQ